MKELLADDSRTGIGRQERVQVIVNPCYGTDKERIVNPPLLMEFIFE
jgi:hypothetical protein